MKNNLFKFLYVTALIVTLLISCKNKTKEPVKTNGENSITVLPNKGNFEQFKDSYIQNLFSKNGQYTLRLTNLDATLYEFYDNQQLESFKEEIKERYIQELTKILNRYL
jgi:uncharacterized protein YpmS